MRMGRRGAAGILLGALAVTMLAACATTKPAEPSLYKRLGGREGIKGVVDEFAAVLMADPRVNARFKAMKGPDLERFKTNAADQVCAAAGGPCSYLGKDMKSAHKGMSITEAEWNATVEDLVQALDKKAVPKKEQQELLSLLGPMKADIVGQ